VNGLLEEEKFKIENIPEMSKEVMKQILHHIDKSI
jgi:hypothetical protein